MATFDVIVVGAGPGGLSAACAAAETGAKVALVETLSHVGGNGILSTGHLVLIDTPFQREHGVQDSTEIFMDDAERQFALEKEKGGLIWDRDLTLLFARESRATYDKLLKLGVKFARLDSKPEQHSVDRLHTLEDPTTLGPLYVDRLNALGVTVFLDTEVRRLITREGTIAGVEALHRSPSDTVESMEIRATAGVVLATGGYQGNFELRRRHQPESAINKHIVGVSTCRGAGHVLGGSVGGDLINMGYIQPMVLVPTGLVQDAVAINLDGNRFHDETGPYARRVEALAQQPGQTAFYIVDAATLTKKDDFVSRMPEAAVVRNSLEELAEAIGCNAEGLATSVRKWNEFLGGTERQDPETGRIILPDNRRKLATPPFAAMRMVRGISFTWGGLVTTLDMQVVTVQGEPVPGLFAVGDTIGGINVLAGMGGLHISPALALGRVAGFAAVKGATAKPHMPAPSQSEMFEPSAPLKMVLFDLDERGRRIGPDVAQAGR